MEIPKKAAEIIDILNRQGHEAFVVGGCVRDMLMKKTPTDWDITTSASPGEVIPLFRRVVETGIQHGTVTVVMGEENFEITTYRIDGPYSDHRRPDQVCFTTDLREDLRRRDFTMNAIAYHPALGFQDPYGGAEDIRLGIIRGVGDPEARFQEDALRMLRAIRFSCRLGFAIEEKTYAALETQVPLIASVSEERIRDELMKTFLGEYVANSFLLLQSGLLEAACAALYNCLSKSLGPDLDSLSRCPQTAHHRFAFLLRKQTPELCGKILTDLKFDNKTIKKIQVLVPLIEKTLQTDPYEIRKCIFKIGETAFFDLLLIQEAMGLDVQKNRELAEYIIKRKDPVTLKSLAVNGNTLMKHFCLQGAQIGSGLEYLMDQVLRDPQLNTAKSLLELGQIHFNKAPQ